MNKKNSNPIFAFLRKAYDWVIHWADHKHNTKALAGLTFIESVFFPLPTDPLLLAMGMARPKKALHYAAITVLASVSGALCGYALGFYGWELIQDWFFKFIITPTQFEYVTQGFQNHVFLTIFIAGFSPIPFKVFTLAGGVASVALLPFTAAAFASRGLRFFILGLLVFLYGQKIKKWLDDEFEKMTIYVSLALVAIVLGLKLAL